MHLKLQDSALWDDVSYPASLVNDANGHCTAPPASLSVYANGALLHEQTLAAGYDRHSGDIYLNDDNGAMRQKHFIHELGHAYGLTHSVSKSDFMFQAIQVRPTVEEYAAQFVAQVGALPCITVTVQ